MALRRGDAIALRLPDGAQLLLALLQRGAQVRPAADGHHPERGGDAQQRGRAEHRAQRRLHHAAQAVPARPHALGGAAEPLRAGGGVHRRVRRGRRRPAHRW